MSARVALCVDSQSCMTPEIVGLDGERFEAQAWMNVFCTGEDARREIAGCGLLEQVWVISSDDVDPINLAATLKADRPNAHVCLVGDGDGSMRSRAYTAAIDEVLSLPEFADFYRRAKAQYGASILSAERIPAVMGEPMKTRASTRHHPGKVGTSVSTKTKRKIRRANSNSVRWAAG